MSVDRRVQYFDAGLGLLAEHGYRGLKLAPLCADVGVTTGAFYHLFKGWKDFTTQLLDHWQSERTTLLIDLARSETSGLDQLEVLLGVTVDLPHAAEAAIRVWSSIDPDVAVVQEAVDGARLAIVQDAIRDVVKDEVDADRLARLGMMVLIGFEVSTVPKDPDFLEWALRMVKDAVAALGREAV